MIRRLLVNTGSNVLVLVVKMAITFVMTPIFVHNLGAYDYGLWEMLGAVIGYMGLLDLGIKPAISRYAAKHQAENDREALQSVYASTFVFMGAVGVLLLAFFSCWALWFPGSLAPEGESYQRYTLLLLIIGMQLLISFPGYVAESYLEGFQRYYLKNNIVLINTLIGTLVIYIYITPENALILLAAANAIGVVIKYVIYMAVLARPSYGAIRFQLRAFSGSRLKEIVVFGFKSFIQGVATRIENATDALVIGIMLGPAVVPIYSIPANLVNYIRTIAATLTHAFMPLFSSLSAVNEHERIRRIYLMSSKYVVGLLVPMSAGVVMIGEPFLKLWIGPDFFKDADLIILLLVIFSVVPFLNPFASRYLTAIGEHGIYARLTPISAIINIVLTVILVHYMGVVGAALASVVPVFIFFPVFLRFVCKHLEITPYRYIRESILPSLLPSLLMVAGLWMFRSEVGIDSYAELLLAIGLGAAIYGVLFLGLALTPGEREFVWRKLGLGRAGGRG